MAELTATRSANTRGGKADLHRANIREIRVKEKVGRAARQSISRNDETEASSIVARGSRTQTVLLTTMRGRNGGRVETKQIIVRPIGAWQDSRV